MHSSVFVECHLNPTSFSYLPLKGHGCCVQRIITAVFSDLSLLQCTINISLFYSKSNPDSEALDNVQNAGCG